MEETKSTLGAVHERNMSGEPDINISAETNSLETPDKANGDIMEGNLVYDDEEMEPEIHARTWIAVLAMSLLNMVQLIALQGPPAVVSGCPILLELPTMQHADRRCGSCLTLDATWAILRHKTGLPMPCHWCKQSWDPLFHQRPTYSRLANSCS